MLNRFALLQENKDKKHGFLKYFDLLPLDYSLTRHLKLGLADWLGADHREWVLKHPGQVVLTVVSGYKGPPIES